MASARSLLARVRRLEAARTKVSPFVRDYGSFEAFEAEVRVGIEARAYDRIDMTSVLNCLRRWESNGTWTR